MTRIKIGLIGCSAIAARSVLPAILCNDAFELVSLGSRSVAKAEQFAQQFGGKPCSYDEVVEDDSIDAIYISLPVGLHFTWAKQALANGKHVLVEKTFTHSHSTAAALVEEGRTRQLVVMEALSYVYHPLFQKIQSIVASGTLGKVRHIEAYFGFPYLPKIDIRNQAALGGGAILDALIYPLSFSLYTCGPKFKQISSHIVYDEERQIDTRGFIQIDWAEISAQIGYGFGFMYRNNCCVWGDSGYLIADRVFSRPKDYEDAIKIVYQGKIESVPVPIADQFGIMLSAFGAAIKRQDVPTINMGEEILDRMKIISTLCDKQRTENKS